MKKRTGVLLTLVSLAVCAVVFLVFQTLLGMAWSGRFPKPTPERYTSFAMGSVLEQTYWHYEHEWWGKQSSKNVIDVVAELEEELNAAEEAPEVIRQLALDSGGAYSPYLGALAKLWNIDSKDGSPPHVPSDEEIQQALAMKELDPGSYGKGAVCDAARKRLPEMGSDRLPLPKALINLGGNICTIGASWEFCIALRDPKGNANDTVGMFTLKGTHFISTSGSYEKFFEQDGVRYHHIFDPETGYPACRDLGLISVTIINDQGALGDALSTASFVLGYEAALPVLEQYNCDAIFLYEDGTAKAAGHVQDYFMLQNNSYHWEGK